MKYTRYFLLTIIAVVSTVSCKKSFIDVDDSSVILREQYVKDLNSLQEYINGLYASLARDGSGVTVSYQLYADLIADNIKPSTNNTSTLIAHYTWNQSTGSSGSRTHMDGFWQTYYQLIRACSFAIEKAVLFKGENANRANRMQAEAYSIRALAHFLLVNIFAQSYNFTPDGAHPGVPYITSWDWNDPTARNSVREVYDGMISDLKSAISLFPSDAVNKITMNKQAAKALLARIYLFMEDWQQAKQLATEVATAVPLLPSAAYPSKLFTPEETEALFQLAPSSTNLLTNSYTTGFQAYAFRTTHFLATRDIADLLRQNSNDKRRGWIKSSGFGRDSIRKYPINVIPGFAANPSDSLTLSRSYYQTLFRSSEMFLTVAEAAAKTGDEVTARIFLDAIKQRADPSAPNSKASGAALLDSIYLERRKELAFEGLRMFDLLRWKQSVKRVDSGGAGAPLLLPYPSDKAISPIPRTDVEIGGIPQNPSY